MSTDSNDPNAPRDERFDQWLPMAARDYNRPAAELPTAPREAMWAAIDGALTSASPDGRLLDGTSRPLAPRGAGVPVGRPRLVPRAWQAAAAVAILAAGIGIGRAWSTRQPGVSPTPDVAATPVAGDSALAPDLAVLEPRGEPATTANRSSLPMRAPAPATASYDVAAVQHLSRAEALLTAFRGNEGNDGGAQMNRWARDLLADTRLLLDSPAATDARRRHLLEDLELVLAQIVQLPAESSADRGLVQRSIERGAVLSRLRSTIPAGYASGT